MKQKQFIPSQRCLTPRFQTGTPQSIGTFKIKRFCGSGTVAIVLTQRQQGLLRWLAENGGQYHSAATLAAAHGISVRTVKSEIAAIRLEIKHSPGPGADVAALQGLPADYS